MRHVIENDPGFIRGVYYVEADDGYGMAREGVRDIRREGFGG